MVFLKKFLALGPSAGVPCILMGTTETNRVESASKASPDVPAVCGPQPWAVEVSGAASGSDSFSCAHRPIGQGIGLLGLCSPAGLNKRPANDLKPRKVGRLTAAQVLELRERRAVGERSARLGREYGISQSMVCLVCTGQCYANIPGPLTRRRLRGSLSTRLLAMAIIPDNLDACWGWLGRLDTDGYPTISFGGEDHGAHRCALEVKLGRELREDEQTRHTCHNRPCTNPRHLIPGTALDNSRDMVEAGRSLFGERGPSHKLTEADVRDIRERASIGPVNYEALGRLHGVTGACVKKVIIGRTWRHLLPVPANARASHAAEEVA